MGSDGNIYIAVREKEVWKCEMEVKLAGSGSNSVVGDNTGLGRFGDRDTHVDRKSPTTTILADAV